MNHDRVNVFLHKQELNAALICAALACLVSQAWPQYNLLSGSIAITATIFAVICRIKHESATLTVPANLNSSPPDVEESAESNLPISDSDMDWIIENYQRHMLKQRIVRTETTLRLQTLRELGLKGNDFVIRSETVSTTTIYALNKIKIHSEAQQADLLKKRTDNTQTQVFDRIQDSIESSRKTIH